MYNNVGLRSARGSGTNCYVQRNVALVKGVRSHALSYEEQKKREAAAEKKVVVHRRANKEILEHEEKRKVEAELIDWAESEGILDVERTKEIEEMMSKKREEIASSRRRRAECREVEEDKSISTHRELVLKEAQQRRFGQAVGVSQDYVEGQGLDPEHRRRKSKGYDPSEVERLKREEQKILLRLEELKRESSSRGELRRNESPPHGHGDHNKRYRHYDRRYSERELSDDERSRYSRTPAHSRGRSRHSPRDRRNLEHSPRERSLSRSVSRSPFPNDDRYSGGQARYDLTDDGRSYTRSSQSRRHRQASSSPSASWSSSSTDSPKRRKYK
ncbi:uncharacterized protein LOC126326133 isoform X3 [Schistocerca gregaria]|uniref:uncharacterized protein LOC126326133 isoform X3 n=1 Tax=Schistocerca gregaria TaxID=7010 RepID=UPI00211F041F|nr:uncharacterized protein LOC126326133 isoform X3 [Schistocerca gregaria]XP_049851523.1 uncharacterized protein LOC126326133 isoform X3 [Schistocerca gregaria]